MAALSATFPSLLDLAKMTDPNGELATVAEILTQTNEIHDYMSWEVGNLPTGHRSVVRTGIPTPTWRKMYGGIQPQKSTTSTITDDCGMLEAMAEVDAALADLSGAGANFLMKQETAFIQGINNELSRTLFFGNTGTQPEAFTGLAPRFNSLSALNGENIIVGGGSGTDNASIWLVYFGSAVHGIVPKGSTAGLQRTHYGKVVIEDASGGSNTGRMIAYRTHYRLDAGLCMPDWRGVVRIPNIDKSDLVKTGATGADLPDLMFQALEMVPMEVAVVGRPVFLMSRAVMSMLRRQLANKTVNSTLGITDVGGRKVYDFQGVPLCRCDALAADEALVS